MAKIQTISLLELLSKPELTALGKALQSPFFTAKKFLYPLFKKLRDPNRIPDESPETIFAQIFKGKTFGDGHKWNKALSDLNACIQEFLVVQQTLSDPRLRAQAEMGALLNRKDEALFQRRFSATLEDLFGNKARETADGWQLRFWMLKLASSHRLTNRMKEPGKILDELDESIDLYYLICKLQLACNRVSLAQFQYTKTDSDSFQRLLQETESLDRAGKSALLSLYRATLRLLTDPNAAIKPFFKLLRALAPRLERAELESIVILGFNYCIRRYRNGEARAFGWYRVGFDWATRQKIWTTEAAPEEFFLNTGVMFAKSQDKAGFEAFLEKDPKALPKNRRDKAVALIQSNWHFYQGEFTQAARLLNQKVDTRHPRYALLFHSLKVRNTFEEWLLHQVKLDELERASQSFEDFLERQNLFAESFCESYHTLIWFIREMTRNGLADGLSNNSWDT